MEASTFLSGTKSNVSQRRFALGKSSARMRCVSQQALSQRLLTFPASMFEGVLSDLLVILNHRWHQRKKRSLPLSVNYAERNFEQLWISVNGIKLQLWATWLFYAVLIDLSDEVADSLTLPFDSLYVEMVFRGIDRFTQALNRGNVADLVAYLTASENHDLGVVKSLRPKRAKPLLDLSAFPS